MGLDFLFDMVFDVHNDDKTDFVGPHYSQSRILIKKNSHLLEHNLFCYTPVPTQVISPFTNGRF